jgi:hypothetical protein
MMTLTEAIPRLDCDGPRAVGAYVLLWCSLTCGELRAGAEREIAFHAAQLKQHPQWYFRADCDHVARRLMHLARRLDRLREQRRAIDAPTVDPQISQKTQSMPWRSTAAFNGGSVKSVPSADEDKE